MQYLMVRSLRIQDSIKIDCIPCCIVDPDILRDVEI
jgi:hypothetical protein